MINIPKNIPIIGIYKITSPTGKIYIGQSTNIRKRYYKYKANKESSQPKIYNSINKHGWENHLFEIIEECSIELLDDLEYFYKKQQIEEIGWENALFCNLIDGKGGFKCEETKTKMRKPKHNEESKLKWSQNRKNKPIHSDEYKQWLSEDRKKWDLTYMIGKARESNIKSVLQCDLEGNIIKEHDALIDAARYIGKKYSNEIIRCCKGLRDNFGGFKWKYKSNEL